MGVETGSPTPVLSLPICRTHGRLAQRLAQSWDMVRVQGGHRYSGRGRHRRSVAVWHCLVDTQTSARRIMGTRGPRRVWPGLMTEGCLGVVGGCSHQGGDKAEASRTPLWTHTGLASRWLSSPQDGHCGPVPALLRLSQEFRVLGFCGLRAEPGFPSTAPPLLSRSASPLPLLRALSAQGPCALSSSWVQAPPAPCSGTTGMDVWW